MRKTSARVIAMMLLALMPACEVKRKTSFLTDENKHEDLIRGLELRSDPEATARKARSIAILRSQGIPVSDQLLPIDPEKASIRRNGEDVAKRAIALAIIFAKGVHQEKKDLEMLIREYKAEGFLSPREKTFLENPSPSDKDMSNFSWRVESLKVMLWAVGYLDKLEWPAVATEFDPIAEILASRDPEEFIKKASLRPQSELLDAADLVLRYDWAAHQQKNGKVSLPSVLDYDVIIERHMALNWLIGHLNEEWDDISLDL